MEQQNKNRGGSYAAGISKKRIIRTSVLIAAAIAIVVSLCVLIAFVVDIFTKPAPKQPERPPVVVDPGAEDPGTDPVTDPKDPGTDDPGPTDPQDSTLKQDFYTFLVAGTSDNYNTDTIMLGAVNTKTLECNIISIPRDSMYDTVSKIKRINGAYGFSYTETYKKNYGENAPRGMDALCEAVRSITGVYPQYYCLVKMDGFIEIVDDIGGVQFNVPVDMYHPDLDPDFHIDLKAGDQLLDGKKALMLVRYRSYKMSDFERMNMQKQFFVTVLQQVKDRFGVKNAAKIVGTVADNIKTDMPVEDMLWFYNNVLSKMNLGEDIHFYTLPYSGTGKYQGQDYVYIDKTAALELLNKTVNPFTTDLTEADVNILDLKD
jgi:LCP family protein required for cell wall assembly